MDLVIVESPTKAKTLKKFLGPEYTVEASMGHIRDLPKSKLGVDVDQNFEPVYEVSEGKTKVIALLKKTAKAAKTVYLASDPDREGEAIAFHLTQVIAPEGKNGKSQMPKIKFKRVTFHEITKTAIAEAIATPGELNLALVDAQQARRVVDRLVGYKLSPVLWKKVRRGLSAGRVQSVAVKLIVEREKEIQAFKPVEYWEVKVETQTNEGERFWSGLYEIDGNKIAIKDQISNDKDQIKIVSLEHKDQVEQIVEALKGAEYTVDRVDRKERSLKPYPPYTTSTLQQAAANVLGWSGKQTMMMAQSLYEAGLITYHRTDSLNLASVAIEGARKVISRQYGAKYLPEKPNFYKTNSKNAQEAHEAIRPTDLEMTSEQLQSESENAPKLKKLYQLIWRRMVACQMAPAVYDATTIIVVAKSKIQNPNVKEYKLKATGSIVKFEGWKAAYGLSLKTQEVTTIEAATEKEQKVKTEQVSLPNVSDGEALKFVDLSHEQKFTQPPPRFNDASLVKELERLGIGRPSTYAPIISTVIARGYIERNEKRFYPTAVGTTVSDFLDENFKEIMDYQFTAEMEEDLDRIAREKKIGGK